MASTRSSSRAAAGLRSPQTEGRSSRRTTTVHSAAIVARCGVEFPHEDDDGEEEAAASNAVSSKRIECRQFFPFKEFLLGEDRDGRRYFADDDEKKRMNKLCNESARCWKKNRLEDCSNVAELQVIAGVFRHELRNQQKQSAALL
ncbi:MAG: hypothetical protein ACREOZ_00355, partial [Gloeomargaritales cyanobacterium]